MKRKSPNAQRMKRQATVDWVFITGGARYRNPLTRETLAAMKPSIMRRHLCVSANGHPAGAGGVGRGFGGTCLVKGNTGHGVCKGGPRQGVFVVVVVVVVKPYQEYRRSISLLAKKKKRERGREGNAFPPLAVSEFFLISAKEFIKFCGPRLGINTRGVGKCAARFMLGRARGWWRGRWWISFHHLLPLPLSAPLLLLCSLLRRDMSIDMMPL